MPLVILLYALFASMFTIAKLALSHCQPFFLVGSRMLVAGALLLLYCSIVQGDALRLRGRGMAYWGKVALLGIFGIYFTNAFEFWGLQYLTSFKTCFIYSLSPFFSALLSFLLFSEKLSLKKWAGLAIGCIGFIPILASESSNEDGLASLFSISWAELAVITAAASTVLGWIVLRDLVTSHKESLVLSNAWSMLIGGALATIHSFFIEDWNPTPVSDFLPFAQLALMMVLISNFICYNLYGHLLKSYTATFLSFAGFMTPIFTAIYGVIFLSEEITWAFLLSSAIVFCGLILFYSEELREGISTQQEADSIKDEAAA